MDEQRFAARLAPAGADRSKPHDRIRVSPLSSDPSEIFRETCAQLASGVAVVAVRAPDGTPHGLTVSSFTPVSLQPPLILVCIDHECTILNHFRAATHFAVNILNAAQRDYSVIFSEKPEGRFEGIGWYPGESGAPLLPDVLGLFECRVVQIVEAGDHAILVAEVIRSESRRGDPLVYFNRAYRTLV